jgi:hypothetical protein
MEVDINVSEKHATSTFREEQSILCLTISRSCEVNIQVSFALTGSFTAHIAPDFTPPPLTPLVGLNGCVIVICLYSLTTSSSYPEDGSRICLRIFCIQLQDYMLSQPRRLQTEGTDMCMSVVCLPLTENIGIKS